MPYQSDFRKLLLDNQHRFLTPICEQSLSLVLSLSNMSGVNMWKQPLIIGVNMWKQPLIIGVNMWKQPLIIGVLTLFSLESLCYESLESLS